MNIKKILCAVDFSPFSNNANEIASAFANVSGAEIVYLHVAEQRAYSGDYDYAMQRTAEKALVNLAAMEPTMEGIPHSHEVKVSSRIADSIVEYAGENEIDLIVIPTHGRTGLRRLIFGSVAGHVIRKANCTVATVRPESEFFDRESKSEWSTGSVPDSTGSML